MKTLFHPALLLLVLRRLEPPRFNHAAFYMRDLKVSVDFYRDAVGLPEIPEPFHDGKHAWFEVGPKPALHIISGADRVLPKEKRTHLCFSVPSVDAFAARVASTRSHTGTWPERSRPSPAGPTA